MFMFPLRGFQLSLERCCQPPRIHQITARRIHTLPHRFPYASTHCPRISQMNGQKSGNRIRKYSDYKKVKEDYYTVLGVPKTATPVEIKRAYEVLKKKFDPNSPSASGRNAKGKEMYQNIEEAYEILSDEKKRMNYDKFGPGVNFSGIDMETIFDSFRSSLESNDPWTDNDTPEDPVRGEDIVLELVLSLEESISGIEKELVFKSVDTCSSCKGVGANETNYETKTCTACSGIGMVKEGKGLFQVKSVCKTCFGLKTVFDPSCLQCKGEGVMESKRAVKIRVPPGVNSNCQLKFPHKGDIGPRNTGKNGDLYVAFKITEHPIFAREGGNIHIKQPITLGQAVLGGKIRIPTLTNQGFEVEIPSCTQPGDKLVLPEMGFKEHGKYLTGNQIVHWDIVVPQKVTKKQEDILWLFGGQTKKIKPPKNQFYATAIAFYDRARFFLQRKIKNEKKH